MITSILASTLSLTVSSNLTKYYDSVMRSAGIYAITPVMVKSFGLPEGYLYIEDLEDSEAPYTDFRFYPAQALNFLNYALEQMSLDLSNLPSSISDFASMVAPYLGKEIMDKSLESFRASYTKETLDEFRNSVDYQVALFNASLQINARNSQYAFFLINTLKHNYLRSLT